MHNGRKDIESAEIVTIGTEMLLGDLVDTNTAWISQRLAALGGGMYRHTTGGDNNDRPSRAPRGACPAAPTPAWVGAGLAARGVSMYRHTTGGDNNDRIIGALRDAASRADLVVTTGGLGPPSHDLTHAARG